LSLVLTLALIALSGGNLSSIANSAVFVIFIVYALVNLSLIWLRYKRPDLERPFRSPIRIGWFPSISGLGLVSSLAMLIQFDSTTIFTGSVVVAIGLSSYFLMEVTVGLGDSIIMMMERHEVVPR
jgi:basic amino acid/polyamine antiporter, APA family